MSAARRTRLLAAGALVLAAATVPSVASAGPAPHRARHVLLISVDGMHESDLQWYVVRHPGSALARLVAGGVSFTAAQAPVPSDSFPGLLAQVTGGDPRTTGVYYDDSYDRRLLPAGTTSCSSTPLGAGVAYTEDDDRDPSRLDAGQGLPGLPRSILDMTPRPRRLLDPATLPVDPASCRPVFPHQFLKVNTVFEVVKAAGMRTAWTDKHPAYEIVNGPSGNGVDGRTVETTRIAPTILALLGLAPTALEAVRVQGTAPLPHF